MTKIKEKLIDDFQGVGQMIEISSSKLYTGGQSLYVCKNSGLVRAKHLRSAEQIAKAWSDEVYGSNFDGETYTARVPAVKARQTYVADFADMHLNLKDKNICDIGAGEGQFFEIISGEDYKANCYGIEPSEKNCKQLSKKGFDCFTGTIEKYIQNNNSSQNKFDVITIMWTLVNSASCLDMMNAAYQMLKPGGHIVVAESSRILVPFKKPLSYYFSKLPVDLHPFHFSANSLTNLLKLSGFKIKHVNRYIDTDYLCLIAEKTDEFYNNSFEIDDYNNVISFFERWHLETETYYKDL